MRRRCTRYPSTPTGRHSSPCPSAWEWGLPSPPTLAVRPVGGRPSELSRERRPRVPFPDGERPPAATPRAYALSAGPGRCRARTRTPRLRPADIETTSSSSLPSDADATPPPATRTRDADSTRARPCASQNSPVAVAWVADDRSARRATIQRIRQYGSGQAARGKAASSLPREREREREREEQLSLASAGKGSFKSGKGKKFLRSCGGASLRDAKSASTKKVKKRRLRRCTNKSLQPIVE
ncbi:hypothetical protein PVAP13_6KG101835 [Panicum virgatum]|uniref:Uncharacterized protein n=1 Tax=Panicum virgatum TaxID=38727 RepID=A0A8T0R9G0_PANVG|nr:hypothetical protein PVAP13_6KG101835 [Panicum virgatum]